MRATARAAASGAPARVAYPGRHQVATVRCDHLRMSDTRRLPALTRSEAEWRADLTPEQYRILREKGTERAFTGELWDEHRSGVYRCAGCGTELFDSSSKFESGTGWPSFCAPATPDAVVTDTDRSFFMT